VKKSLKRYSGLPGILAFLLLPGVASAGKIMDYIRNYDLNDYSLGVSLTTSQNPYTNAEDSTFAYPYLTSFTHPAFTDDWLLLTDGKLGFRKVTDDGWMFGAVGRIQTLGLGSEKPDELLGLNEKQWTIEIAPFIGYRGWPVHLNYEAFKEVSGRHGGWTQELTFSYPLERSWGFFVPSIGIAYLDDTNMDYYFAVTEEESRPGRPVYDPGSSTIATAKLRVGYQVSNKWLLSADVAYEYLGDEIFDSPIVDRDHLWSGSIGLAYNANIFQRREYKGDLIELPRFEFRAGIFADSIDTTITRNGDPGNGVDIENVFTASDRESVLQLDAIARIGHYHRLEFNYFDLSRNSTATPESDISLGSETFLADSEVKLKTDFRTASIAYAYSLMNDAQKELGISFGVHAPRLKLEVSSPETGANVVVRASTPLPVVGLHGKVSLGSKSYLNARVQLFRLKFDHVEGSLTYFRLEWQRMLGQRSSIGIGYNFYDTKLDSDHIDIDSTLEVRHQGPFAFLGMHF